MSSADELSDSPTNGDSKTFDTHSLEVSKTSEEAFEPLSKEDLSDVSDLESHDGLQEPTVRSPHKTMQDQLETELDFEAEEKDDDQARSEAPTEAKSEGELKDADNDLEEGECTDAEDARPEEESKPVCRFYNRGQCTWGANCRFVHPGVTDKGNYTMFDMVRPLVPTNGPPGSDQYFEKQYGSSFSADPQDGAPLESAWERGLRHAKEMMKKATRRKETDMDFEEKKMNLSLGQEDLDKENDFYTRPASPIHRFEENGDKKYSRENPEYYNQEGWSRSQESSSRHLESYYKHRQHRDSYGDSTREERSGHRDYSHSPEHSSSKGHSKYRERDEKSSKGQQKVKADDWSDPWMRRKSPTRKGTSWKRSHSSDSSVSSSSESSGSDSSSSSDSRYSGHAHPAKRGKYDAHPSKVPSKFERTTSKPKEIAPIKKRPTEDMSKKIRTKTKDRGRRRASSVSSLDSNSSLSSSSDDKPPSKMDRNAEYAVSKPKAMDALKLSGQKQQIKLTLRENESPTKPESSAKKKVAAVAAVVDAKAGAKKSTTRREELLKQLKAVEDAIRRKKTKPT